MMHMHLRPADTKIEPTGALEQHHRPQQYTFTAGREWRADETGRFFGCESFCRHFGQLRLGLRLKVRDYWRKLIFTKQRKIGGACWWIVPCVGGGKRSPVFDTTGTVRTAAPRKGNQHEQGSKSLAHR